MENRGEPVADASAGGVVHLGRARPFARELAVLIGEQLPAPIAALLSRLGGPVEALPVNDNAEPSRWGPDEP